MMTKRILAVALFFCSVAAAQEPSAFKTLFAGCNPVSRHIEGGNLVVGNAEEFQSLWTRLELGDGAPPVDFTKASVLAAWGQAWDKCSCGALGVKISPPVAVEGKPCLEAVVERPKTLPGCEGPARCQSVHIVAVARPGREMCFKDVVTYVDEAPNEGN